MAKTKVPGDFIPGFGDRYAVSSNKNAVYVKERDGSYRKLAPTNAGNFKIGFVGGVRRTFSVETLRAHIASGKTLPIPEKKKKRTDYNTAKYEGPPPMQDDERIVNPISVRLHWPGVQGEIVGKRDRFLWFCREKTEEMILITESAISEVLCLPS